MAQRVSLCMIVKNEEGNLPTCLESAADLVHEIVVVDTGSTDGTKDVAARFGARIFDFTWIDDFAAARNESLKHATCEWIFWLDADERLDEENRERLRAVIRDLKDENVAFMMKQLSPVHGESAKTVVFNQARLFRNHPEIRWRYRVHEQILPAVERLGGEARVTDINIQHAGFVNRDFHHGKNERYLRLLELGNLEHPDDPFTLFNLGWAYQDIGRLTEALPLLRRSLERSPPASSMIRKLFALLARVCRRLGQRQEALAYCREGRSRFPDDTELLFLEGLVRCESGDTTGGEACWLQLLHSDPGNYISIGVDPGLRGYLTRQNLALLYVSQGRLADAETQLRAVLAEQPDHTDAWMELSNLWRTQGRWQDLEYTSQQLAAHPTKALEAAMLKASAHFVRREYADARQLLEQTIAQSPPTLLWPRVLLTEVLYQDGRDWAALEKAIHDVLAIDPQHSGAKEKLAALMQASSARS